MHIFKTILHSSIVKHMRTTHPRVFFWLAYCAARVLALADRPRYMLCRFMNWPYFGPVMMATPALAFALRRPRMDRLIRREVERTQGPFNVIEVGSWVGNSAIVWAHAVRESGKGGTVVCVDPWRPYVESVDTAGDSPVLLIMNQELGKGHVFDLFLHNVKASGNNRVILPFKASSLEALPKMAAHTFDFAYIDAAHNYSDLLADLRRSAPLVKEGGIICGDDMELQVHEVDADYAWEHREQDFLRDPKTGRDYHPGVATAVKEFFGVPVSSGDGFWAMRKEGTQWNTVEL